MATTTSILVEPVEHESITLNTEELGSPSKEHDTVSILKIPTELKLLIIQNLDLVDQICLKMTCQTFNTLIPRLAMPQLLEVERSAYGTQEGKERYACKDCLRILPKTAFGDQMVKDKKGKNGTYRENRFCVQCGINPRPGTTRYSRGDCIERQGEHFVVCLRCAKYGRGAVEGLCKLAVCQSCRVFLRAARCGMRRRGLGLSRVLGVRKGGLGVDPSMRIVIWSIVIVLLGVMMGCGLEILSW
jgi:hypothetical protein